MMQRPRVYMNSSSKSLFILYYMHYIHICFNYRLYNDLARVYSGLNPEVQASIRERAIERADAVPVAMDDWIQIFKLGLVQFIQEVRTRDLL